MTLSAYALTKLDPYMNCNFAVEIDGILTASFSSVSGLDVNIATEEIEEGGQNDFKHTFPTRTTYGNIKLKRGVGDFDYFAGWIQDTIAGTVERRNGTIYLLAPGTGLLELRIATWWNFYEAIPVSWAGPDFDAQENSVAIEEIELAHHGITLPTASTIYSGIFGGIRLLSAGR